MTERITQLNKEVSAFCGTKAPDIEDFRIQMLGKKGKITLLFDDFKQLSGDEKKAVGQLLNQLKNLAQQRIAELKQKADDNDAPAHSIDTSRPAAGNDEHGSRHPIAVMRSEILAIFGKLGFTIAEGPEIEDDWHVFGALNFAPEHPARDMQDTFFIDTQNADNPTLLRTHTSSVQVRTMENQAPPIRVVCPGRVYRNEAISARAHCMFHQVEGLYVDKDVSFADLKQTLLYFAKEMFGNKVEIRLRPSFFPFTEPSAEMDVSCSLCGGKGCNVCKGTGWLEVGGCGMVHPKVLQANKIDPAKYSGFAFGMGIERLVMLKYQVRDLRLYFENDVRFLRQFR
ncbi:phenylalanine--tRNA ligase alpha subunit [Bacteroidia bacterium]|nr:phenylalanine--tRNA ligase alpha subunit [Bacteroidia bacterium]